VGVGVRELALDDAERHALVGYSTDLAVAKPRGAKGSPLPQLGTAPTQLRPGDEDVPNQHCPDEQAWQGVACRSYSAGLSRFSRAGMKKLRARAST
jgi:hypothetical protein